MKRDKWIWMPHPGHLIVGFDCRFHLNTWVGKVIVSTVGEYLPDEGVREIIAQSRGISLKGRGDERRADFLARIGFQEIGLNRKYETMVFAAEWCDLPEEDCCCPYRAAPPCRELAMAGANDPGKATANHNRLCEDWSDDEFAASQIAAAFAERD